MKYIIIFFLPVLIFSCQEECKTPKLEERVILADVTDTAIVKNFLSEKNLLCGKMFVTPISRCEGLKITCIPIGATIENNFLELKYPKEGAVAGNTGNYDLSKINDDKIVQVNSYVDSCIQVFSKSISPKNSQIWHTIHSALEKYKTAQQIIIATDLLDNTGRISFYKPFDLNKMLESLKEEYQIKNFENAKGFKGQLIIVSPIAANQRLVLTARNFYKYYFEQLGIAQSQIQFISSISQIK